MNNLAARLFFSFIGLLFCVSFILNKWIHKELGTTETEQQEVVKPVPKVEVVSVAEQYDMDSDYAPGQAYYVEEMPKEKKPDRIPSEKIIYEMPTSNKFLLQ